VLEAPENPILKPQGDADAKDFSLNPYELCIPQCGDLFDEDAYGSSP
jgi:hypothetical protein